MRYGSKHNEESKRKMKESIKKHYERKKETLKQDFDEFVQKYLIAWGLVLLVFLVAFIYQKVFL